MICSWTSWGTVQDLAHHKLLCKFHVPLKAQLYWFARTWNLDEKKSSGMVSGKLRYLFFVIVSCSVVWFPAFFCKEAKVWLQLTWSNSQECKKVCSLFKLVLPSVLTGAVVEITMSLFHWQTALLRNSLWGNHSVMLNWACLFIWTYFNELSGSHLLSSTRLFSVNRYCPNVTRSLVLCW